jgi:hypothetical protein
MVDFNNNTIAQENDIWEDTSEAAHSNSCPICLDSIDEVFIIIINSLF